VTIKLEASTTQINSRSRVGFIGRPCSGSRQELGVERESVDSRNLRPFERVDVGPAIHSNGIRRSGQQSSERWPLDSFMRAPPVALKREWPEKLARMIGTAFGHAQILWANSALNVTKNSSEDNSVNHHDPRRASWPNSDQQTLGA
jgi:hypothetical protein